MTEMDKAKHRLFDVDGLAARNVSVFLGTARDVSAEQMAQQINRGLSQLEAGEYEEAVLE